ncbi:MAG: hypothetical protein IK031_03305 [Bacteroidales bacterium]|nr:hypothetical protein [Bacteroidales bacterium]
MKKTYISPAFCDEPMEASIGFLQQSNEGYDVDPFNPDFISPLFEL